MATYVAIGPEPVPEWLVAAVEHGGGTVVAPEQAEVLVWERHASDGFAEFFAAAPKVRWVQLPSAGIEWLFEEQLYDPKLIWTCAKGAFSDNVAELAMGLLLAGFRSMHTFLRATEWLPEAGRTLQGAHIGILGGGGITRSLLPRLAPFEVETTVMRRRPQPMEGAGSVVGPDELPKLLSSADAVVVALPLTPATRGLIDAAALSLMQPDAWLVNVARGGIVQTDALVDALTSGQIGGAALDVTDPEPLPAGHPLWTLPNVIITPHVANTLGMSPLPYSQRVQENLQRWQHSNPLVGIVDGAAGY
jgi:phosphoglycerate dehydrogenase-like enzyme